MPFAGFALWAKFSSSKFTLCSLYGQLMFTERIPRSSFNRGPRPTVHACHPASCVGGLAMCSWAAHDMYEQDSSCPRVHWRAFKNRTICSCAGLFPGPGHSAGPRRAGSTSQGQLWHLLSPLPGWLQHAVPLHRAVGAQQVHDCVTMCRSEWQTLCMSEWQGRGVVLGVGKVRGKKGASCPSCACKVKG